MVGGFFILDDPILKGLMASLIFDLLASTIQTLLLIPVVYYAAMRNRLKEIHSEET
jgi:multidrug efflux pump subunit AcrB